MKKIICLLLAFSLLSLAACAAKADPPEADAPSAAPESVTRTEPVPEPAEPEAGPASEPGPVSEPLPNPEPAGEEETPPSALDAALSCAGQDVSALYAAVGQPKDSFYEYSCSGPGDDGVLYYDGFLVFTYRENGVETVVDAEADE